MLRAAPIWGLPQIGIEDVQIGQARFECGVSKREDFDTIRLRWKDRGCPQRVRA